MIVWDGEKNDTTNFKSDKFLKINSCGFQNILSDRTIIRKKGRKDYHLLLIDKGKCEVLYRNKLYTLTDGNLIIYKPDEEQMYTFKTESTSLWCHFTGSVVEELLDTCGINGGVYFLSPNRTVFEAYSSMIQRFNQPGRERFANVSFLELIYSISDAVFFSDRNKEYNAILPIVTYININYNKQLTLDELAKKAGYSKSRFSHIFSEVMGITPMKYQNDMRLKVSCEMLASTELSVSAVAYSCGFKDPLYYSRMFKRKYNMTPTEYRLTL